MISDSAFLVTSSSVCLGASVGSAIYFRSHPFRVGTVLLALTMVLLLGALLLIYSDRGDWEGMFFTGVLFLFAPPVTILGAVALSCFLWGAYRSRSSTFRRINY
jgi:hypothetical protein